MKSFALALSLLALPSLLAADLTSAGNWKVSFDEPSGSLVLENAVRKVRLEGRASFRSRGRDWKVALSRDAARNRLCLVNPGNTVLGYVSFRGEGDRMTLEVFHRAGANFFPGTFGFDGRAGGGEGQGAGRARGQGFRGEVRHRRSEARLHAEIGGGRA